jgi:hypothetical protein
MHSYIAKILLEIIYTITTYFDFEFLMKIIPTFGIIHLILNFY